MPFDALSANARLTVPVGAIDAETARLLKVTEASLHAGIAVVRPGATLGDVGAAVQSVVEAEGFRTWSHSINLAEGEIREMEASLQKQ